MSDDEDRVTVGCKVAPEKRRDLRLLAANRDMTMSALLREEIDELLKEADDVPESVESEEQPAD